ncbi:Hypothetical protein PHPALM_17937 [Phytophthora palmivora]|uniref:DDE-1 domain-containing protein n=1 Tax=Phytophthora palmivora TaxID=4796 RepID=A0A2P4XKZ9_9STRA|nr:Hypothetical protein PHPALM_17937 [Phytophthora palmivora]
MTRPRTARTGRRHKKYIRIAVDYTHKSRILDRLAEGVKVATVIEEFYPSISKAERKRKQKQISKWKGQAGFIQNVCDEGKGHLQNYRRNGDATVLSAEAENDIVLWLNSIRKEGCPVSGKMPEVKALEIAADAVRAAILKHNISNVFNADQTSVFFEYLPRTTITDRGQKTVWVKISGNDKERATVMLLADWHGNKRAPFLVSKSGVSRHKHVQDINETKRHGFGVRLWQEISQLQHQHGCQIYGNISAWWNTQISLKFLAYHFGDRDDMVEKILLLWDGFSGHWTQGVTEHALSLNVILLKVPPRYSYVCQPADVAWNQPFMTRLRSLWVDCLRAQIAEHHALEKPFEMVAPKRPDITSWIAESWTQLTTTTIFSGFSKTELLGDNRKVENRDEEDDVDKISALLDHLADLGAANEAVNTDDEFVSSESYDDE